jgi:cysteine desulfurase
MKVPYTAAHGAIRFSFCRENTDQDVDQVLEAVPPIIAKLRELSPFWQGADKAPAAFNPTFA